MELGDWLTQLGRIWSTCDNIGKYLYELIAETTFGFDLESGGPLWHMMDSDERKFYEALPEEVIIYRGCYKNNKWGLSWTLDREVAKKFSMYHRYRQAGQPILLKALAKKENIAAVKLDRNESEIITYFPKHISTTYLRHKPISL